MSGAPGLRLGTRGSALALRQAGMVAAAIARGGTDVELVTIRTSGDAHVGSLAAVGGKGLFVKEIEEALLDGRIDLAVHSLKDLPAELPAGLAVVATPPREDPRDALVTTAGHALAGLPARTRVGTSSLRRRAQLLARRSDLRIVDLRGNVDTRLAKLAAGEIEAVVIAVAGLNRLGLAPRGVRPLERDELLPAIGQGALAIEARADDAAVAAVVRPLDDVATASCVAAERAFLVAVGGDCQTPLAAHAEVVGTRLCLRALVAEVDGSRVLTETADAEAREAADLGCRLADVLLARGAAEIIARARAATARARGA